jgi:hypothetical protein
MARPRKFTPEIAEEICKAVAAGVPENYAATAAGIHRDTMHHWKKRNAAFADAVKKARAQAIQVRIERIEKAARGGEEVEVSEKTIKHKDGKLERIVIRRKTAPSWTADAWYLERQFCEEFGLNRLDLKELLKILRASRAGKQVEERHGSEADQGNAKKDDER